MRSDPSPGLVQLRARLLEECYVSCGFGAWKSAAAADIADTADTVTIYLSLSLSVNCYRRRRRRLVGRDCFVLRRAIATSSTPA